MMTWDYNKFDHETGRIKEKTEETQKPMTTENNEVNLLPCPFCARIPNIIKNGAGDLIIEHDEHDCPCDATGWCPEVWNHRSPVAQGVEEPLIPNDTERIRQLQIENRNLDAEVDRLKKENEELNVFLNNTTKDYKNEFENRCNLEDELKSVFKGSAYVCKELRAKLKRYEEALKWLHLFCWPNEGQDLFDALKQQFGHKWKQAYEHSNAEAPSPSASHKNSAPVDPEMTGEASGRTSVGSSLADNSKSEFSKLMDEAVKTLSAKYLGCEVDKPTAHCSPTVATSEITAEEALEWIAKNHSYIFNGLFGFNKSPLEAIKSAMQAEKESKK
jgi:hypothetical protein